MQINDRVGAIMDSKDGVVRLFGYGIYSGEEVPPPEIKFMGLPIKNPNPKIVLDNGKVVWGCECWWGPEERVTATLARKKVAMVDIEQARKAANEP